MEGWNEKPSGWEETNDRYRLKHICADVKVNFEKNTDVIIVMAGGLADDGTIHPWVKKRLDLALDLYKKLQKRWNVFYDASGAIGRRYRRQDEIGTPYGITIDFDTL